MADIVVVLAGARLIAVLAPVTFGAKFFAACPSETRLALAPAVHRIACGIVVAITLVRAVGAERSQRARLTAICAPPTAGATALAVHMETLSVVLTRALAKAPATKRAGGTRLHAEESGVTRFTLALAREEVASAVAGCTRGTSLLAVHTVEAFVARAIAPRTSVAPLTDAPARLGLARAALLPAVAGVLAVGAIFAPLADRFATNT